MYLLKFLKNTLCEKCPNTEFFWFVFSRIWTEYGDLHSDMSLKNKSPLEQIKQILWVIS